MASAVVDATDYNSATLSGAVDVVAVQHEDGTFKSTPFHVRFGKFKVLRSKKKPVKIFVNNVEAPFKMKLGPEGAAYFVHETDSPVQDTNYVTSPLGSPVSSPDVSPRSTPLNSPRSDSEDMNFSLESTNDVNTSNKTSTEVSPVLAACGSRSLSRGSSRDAGNASDCELDDHAFTTEDESDQQDTSAPMQQTLVKGSLNEFVSDLQANGNKDETNNTSMSFRQRDFNHQKVNHPWRERRLSTSRPWISYDNQASMTSDFIYPANSHPIEMTVRNTFEHSVAISSAFQVIVWEFKTKVVHYVYFVSLFIYMHITNFVYTGLLICFQAYNVGFSVEFHVTNEITGILETHVIRPDQRIDSHLQANKGLFVSPCAGLLLLKWDNTFSKLRNKYLQYHVYHVGSSSHGSNVGSASDGVHNSASFATGSMPPSIQFCVSTEFGLGRLAVPCTESSPTVAFQLFTESAAEHTQQTHRQYHSICYCDRSKVKAKYDDHTYGSASSHSIFKSDDVRLGW